MEWTRQGKFEYTIKNESFRIFPKGKDGKTRPVWVKRAFLHLRRKLLDDTFAEIFFKYYLHQRNFYWADGRQKGSCHRRHVRKELARMLFEKNEERATALMTKVEGLLV
jgi:hypothetical protein